jgi:hypothetical protein
VRFDDAEAGLQPQIDAAYQTKYAALGGSYVRRMVGPAAVATTLRLQPVGSATLKTDQRRPGSNRLTGRREVESSFEL